VQSVYLSPSLIGNTGEENKCWRSHFFQHI